MIAWRKLTLALAAVTCLFNSAPAWADARTETLEYATATMDLATEYLSLYERGIELARAEATDAQVTLAQVTLADDIRDEINAPLAALNQAWFDAAFADPDGSAAWEEFEPCSQFNWAVRDLANQFQRYLRGIERVAVTDELQASFSDTMEACTTALGM